MRTIVTKGFEFFNSVYGWLKHKNSWGFQRSAIVLMFSFIVAGMICCYSDDRDVSRIAAYAFVLILFAMSFVFCFDAENKTIKRLSKGKYSTIRELMRNMSHISYIYGLLCVSFELFFIFESILIAIRVIAYGSATGVALKQALFVSLFGFTFVYFLYHIYVSSSSKLDEIYARIQLYTAIGASMSFVMLILGENKDFKIFVVGTMAEYVWLQFIISKERIS